MRWSQYGTVVVEEAKRRQRDPFRIISRFSRSLSKSQCRMSSLSLWTLASKEAVGAPCSRISSFAVLCHRYAFPFTWPGHCVMSDAVCHQRICFGKLFTQVYQTAYSIIHFEVKICWRSFHARSKYKKENGLVQAFLTWPVIRTLTTGKV